MRLEILKDYNSFVSLKELWDEVLETSSLKTIFLTWEWIDVWWKYFGKDNTFFIISGYDETNRLIGIAPLMVRKKKFLGVTLRSIELLGSGHEVTPDHLSFIVSEERRSEFIRDVFVFLDNIRDKWDIINLSDMQEDINLYDNLKLFNKNDFKTEIILEGKCPYIALPKTWEEYFAKFSRKTRYNLRRIEKEFERDFKVEFMIFNDGKNLKDIFNFLYKLHIDRMKEKGRKGISQTKIFWDFHSEISKILLSKDRLFLGLLKANDEIISFYYNFIYDNKVMFYQSGFSSKFSSYGVGNILTMKMIQESIKRGCIEYDFLRGEEEYKKRWASNERDNIRIIVWKKTFLPFLNYIMRKAKIKASQVKDIILNRF